jgi:hypothetical protein
MTNPLIQSCESCEHWDGDCFCALPAKDRLISGHIVEAESVVCAKWEKRESDRHDAIRRDLEAEAGAIERKRYETHTRY